MIEKMLTLSTAHMPSFAPDFKHLRTIDDEYGTIVAVCSVMNMKQDTPEWIWPIIEHARRHECRYIYFDRDTPTIDGIKTYDWY